MNKILIKYKSMPVIAKASLWFLICSFLQKGISIISTPIFTRLLSTAEFGRFNVFTSWEYILNIFISLCLSAGVYQQGLVKFEDDRKRFSSSMQGLTFVLVLTWTIIYIIFRKLFNQILGLSTLYMISMIIIIWTNNVYAFWSNEQKTQFKYKKVILLTLLTSVLSPMLSIFLICNLKDKVFGRILGMVIIALIFYVGLFIKQILAGRTIFDLKYWKYALMYNIPLIPHYLSQTILSSSDRIMIEKMVDSNSAGIYSLAYSLALVMTIFNNSLMQTISPWMYKKIKNREIKEIKNVAYFSLIVIAIANICLIALAPEAVHIFAPKEYYQAIYVIPPVAMSVFFMYMYDLFAKFEFYYEKTKFITTATLIGAVCNLILNFIFIKLFGYIAAAYTTLLCYFLYAVFHYIAMSYICKKELNGNNPYNFTIISTITIVFVLLGFIFMLFYNSLIPRIAIIFIILFIVLLYRNKIKYYLNLLIKNKRKE